MNKQQLNSLFASIDAQRDAFRCESAVVRFYPVPQSINLVRRVLDNGKVGVSVKLTLNYVNCGGSCEMSAYRVLSPIPGEPIDTYLDRLKKHLIYLDDHASFIEFHCGSDFDIDSHRC